VVPRRGDLGGGPGRLTGRLRWRGSCRP
jgi:hypothetical protein